MGFSPCPIECNREGCAPAEGDPPPQHRRRQIPLLPRDGRVPWPGRGLWGLILEVQGWADVPGWTVLCLSMSVVVENQPLKRRWAPSEPRGAQALPRRPCPGQGAEEDLICIFACDTARSGSHIPRFKWRSPRSR